MARLVNVGFNDIHKFHWAFCLLLTVLPESLILVDCQKGDILYWVAPEVRMFFSVK